MVTSGAARRGKGRYILLNESRGAHACVLCMPYSGTGELICPHILMNEEKADMAWFDLLMRHLFAFHVFALPCLAF